MRYTFALLAALGLITVAPQADAMGPWKKSDCHLDQPCELGARSYHVMEPDGWDGETPLPVLVHYHGWGRNGIHAQKSDRIGASTKRRGVLLVTPNSVGRAWNYWSPDSTEVDFTNLVLEDVAKHYPVDLEKIYVSGYSLGSVMAWRYACESGDHVAALLAIAGTMRTDVECAEAPHEVRHVHGLDDSVMGFPTGPGNDPSYAVGLWRARLGCGAGQDGGDWQVREFLTFHREAWECDAGKVVLDLHPGGHFVPHGWIGRQLDELLGLTPSYP
ncbi:polyhydroxybutyrate depolymerase [Epibacterium sp. SM1979]|uniref:Polyhydroxybutyrate depolymerase n=1 Tax=Tritonibacter litoralis TaxID=2662264 RepID=A0A843YHV3_9RHOB|nr:polyhydroxybutyrate depolymerase [Tritonibacter litoralis]MQQ10431.1 polyhydroxybutyrate depolymerase [Tritonibacter litoralis]